MNQTKVQNYLELLKIRRTGIQRAVTIIRGVWVLCFIALLTLGIVGQITTRSLVLAGAIVIVFSISWITAWVKLEIVQRSIELLKHVIDDDKNFPD